MRILSFLTLVISTVCASPHDLDIRVGRFQGGIVTRHSFQPKEVASGQQDVAPLLKYLGVPHISYQADELIKYGKVSATSRDRTISTVSLPSNKLPFSSTYWPMIDGGIDARWHRTTEPSALEKYCSLYLDTKTTNVTREWVKKNQGPAVPNVASWFGICQGWSGAAVYEKPPQRDVWVRSIKRTGTFAPSQQYLTVECSPEQILRANITGCVKFFTGDVTGLISESFASGNSVFIGQRCDIAQESFILDQFGRVSVNSRGSVSATKCRSNPATLFLTTTNFIGRSQHGFVINCVNNDEVWNQPAYSYRITSYQNITFEHATYLVDDQDTLKNDTSIKNATVWRFNPTAKSLRHVRMTLIWAVETSQPPVGVPTLRPASGDYEFILELDATGKVIGGEWLYDSKQDHPPFYWVPIEPARDGDSGIPPNFYYGNVKQILTISQSRTPTWQATINTTANTRIPDECNQYFTCTTCTSAPGQCGWCQTTGMCQLGTGVRSNDGKCNRTTTGGTWQWTSQHCTAMTPAPPTTAIPTTPVPTVAPTTPAQSCIQYKDCSTCTTDGSVCGWCLTTGRCQDGSATSSTDGVCTRTNAGGTWSWLAAQCGQSLPTTVTPTVRPTIPTTVRPTIPTTPVPTTTVPPTVPATIPPTEPATLPPTEPATVPPTEPATVAPTTDAPTPTTEPTIPTTETPVIVSSSTGVADVPTDAPTEVPTDAPTEAPTNAPIINSTIVETTEIPIISSSIATSIDGDSTVPSN